MSQVTYQQTKTGRLMEVGEWETVRRSILERTGWVQIHEVEAEPEPETSTPDEEQWTESDWNAARTHTASDVAERAGASHLLDALLEAGFVSAESVVDASLDDLTAVSGIGKATAKKLQKAADELING